MKMRPLRILTTKFFWIFAGFSIVICASIIQNNVLISVLLTAITDYDHPPYTVIFADANFFAFTSTRSKSMADHEQDLCLLLNDGYVFRYTETFVINEMCEN